MKKLFVSLIILVPILAHAEVRATNPKLADRMNRYSEKLLGQPYLVDPLGEGADGTFDRDPRFREDGFDCTTFVETVVSVAKAKRKVDILNYMDTIRYKFGQVSFETRNHFTGLDWIRNNSNIGLLRDITQSISPENTYLASALVEKDEWYKKLKIERLSGIPDDAKQQKLKELHSLSKRFGKKTEKVPFLHKQALVDHPEIIDRIPDGSIINIVRPNWDLTKGGGTHMNISHQGLAFHKNGVVYFRNAKAVYKDGELVKSESKISEEPLYDYIKRTVPSQTIQGINVLIVR